MHSVPGQHLHRVPSGTATGVSTEQVRAVQDPHRLQSVVMALSDHWPVTMLENGGLLQNSNRGSSVCAPCMTLGDSALAHFISCLVLKEKARSCEPDSSQ